MSEQKLFGSNRDLILEEVERVKCTRYEGCPICNKCVLKASHLNLKCHDCAVPLCVHTHAQKVMMIKRHNFALENPSPELVQALRSLDSK